MLRPGDEAPDFTLESDSGTMVTLSDLGDKPVVLFFYPQDDTPGCTIECSEFRDARSNFEGKAHVIGVSGDGRRSHAAFRDKLALNFPLLSDEEGSVAEAFGVWSDTQWGAMAKRTTFIIRRGTIAEVFENVKPRGHAAEVLGALDPS